MIQTRNRFQYEVATGRATLPVVSTLTLILWVISTPHLWANIGSLLIFSLTTYLLLETDTKFALIRTRTTLPASFFLLFYAATPFLHTWDVTLLLPVFFLCMLYSLFQSYESPHASTAILHAFLWMGLSSLILPCIAWITPLLYIHMINLRSLEGKTFFAGIIGFTLPYWLLLGYDLYTDQTEEFYNVISHILQFDQINYASIHFSYYTLWGAVTILWIAFSIPYLRFAYKDKVQTRILLQVILSMGVWINILMVLQPSHIKALLPLAIIPMVFMGGHLFSLTFSKFTRITFITVLVIWFALCLFNLWIYFFNF